MESYVERWNREQKEKQKEVMKDEQNERGSGQSTQKVKSNRRSKRDNSNAQS